MYLACKVEEFNISIQQFVANIRGDREKASDIILNDELLLMQQLNFHLTIHNPYRPVTGLLIDIKVCVLVQQRNCRSVERIQRIRISIGSLSYLTSVICHFPSAVRCVYQLSGLY